MELDMNLINEASKIQHSVEEAKKSGAAITKIAVSEAFFNFCMANTPGWDKTLYSFPVAVDSSLASDAFKIQ